MKETAEERVNDIDIDLRELVGLFIRKWWVFAICVVLGFSIVLGWTIKFVTPTYQSYITIYVNNNNRISSENEVEEYRANSDIVASQRLVNTYMSIAKSDRVLGKVAESLGGEYNVAQLSGMITTNRFEDTEIFGIYIVNSDPGEAARIANTFAIVAPMEISALIEGTSARVIDTAKIATARYSPSYRRAALLGATLGLLAAIVFLTIRYLSDTRIKNEEDLTSLFTVPVLGRIPNFEFVSAGHKYGYSSGKNKYDYKYGYKSAEETEEEAE